jgi:hypothetical protein
MPTLNNEFGDTLFRLHLIALQPEADALHDRLADLLDEIHPTHAASVDALSSLLIQCLSTAPPRAKEHLVGCVVKALTDAVSWP